MTNQGEKTSPPKTERPKNGLTWIMFIVAAIAMLFIKPSQYLRKRAYNDAKLAPFVWFAGLVTAAGAGVLLGSQVYPLGIEWWLSFGVGAVVATYYYLWPALYLAIFRWSFSFGNFLWQRVPSPSGANAYGYSPWLSRLLVGVAYVASVVICLVLWYNFATSIHDKIGWTSDFGNTVSWVASIVASAVISFVIAGLSFALIGQGMPALAIATGIGAAYLATSRLELLVQSHEWPAQTVYGLQTAVVLLWVAYAFPIAHLVVTRLFRPLGDYLIKAIDYAVANFGNLLDWTYGDNDKNYVGFTRHVANLALAGFVGYYAFGHSFVEGSLAFAAAQSAVAAVIAYMAGGFLLKLVHNMLVGIVASAFAAYTVFGMAAALGVPFGAFGAYTSGALTFIASMIIGFPVAYQLVKFVCNPLLASWLGQPLEQTHRTLCNEIGSSLENTYGDKTPYGEFFGQAVGILATVGTYLGMTKLVVLLGFGAFNSVVLPIAATVAVYLAAGKLFTRYGNPLIGVLLAVSIGVVGGVSAYQHFAENSLIWGIGAFFVSGLATAFVAFPVSYVIARAVLNLVRVTAWALPVVAGVHGFFFGFVSVFWSGVVTAYRAIEAAWTPAWQSVSKMWDESWESAKAMFEESFGSKKK